MNTGLQSDVRLSVFYVLLGILFTIFRVVEVVFDYVQNAIASGRPAWIPRTLCLTVYTRRPLGQLGWRVSNWHECISTVAQVGSASAWQCLTLESEFSRSRLAPDLQSHMLDSAYQSRTFHTNQLTFRFCTQLLLDSSGSPSSFVTEL
jgi:hypothetical protein